MQPRLNLKSKGSSSFLNTILKGLMIIAVIGVAFYLLDKVDFPSPQNEIKEDENNRRYVETIINRSTQVNPREEPLGETLMRTAPSLHLNPMHLPRFLPPLSKRRVICRRLSLSWQSSQTGHTPRRTCVPSTGEPNLYHRNNSHHH